jgi:hypothetical protein
MTAVVAVPELPSVAVTAQNPGVLLAVYVVVGVVPSAVPVLPVVVLNVPQVPTVENVTVSLKVSAAAPVTEFDTVAVSSDVAAPFAGMAGVPATNATWLAGSTWLITAVLVAPLSPSFAVIVQTEAVPVV